MIEIKKLSKQGIIKALPMIWEVFLRFEGEHYSEEGRQLFKESINSSEYLDMLKAFGAFVDDNLVGIIATRNEGKQLALFYVNEQWQGKGVGRQLWNTVLKYNIHDEINVHSSIYAKDIYERLGFISTEELQNEGEIKYVPMKYESLLPRLKDKNHKRAYDYATSLIVDLVLDNRYYTYFDEFATLLDSTNSFVRTRGFLLCCGLARWDKLNKIEKHFDQLAPLIHDEKPTVVRQCLLALHEVALYKPELCDRIRVEINIIDLAQYKDSMAPLIEKDIMDLEKLL